MSFNGSQVQEIFVADYNNHRVQVFDTNGSFLRSFGGQGSQDHQFYHTSGVALSNNNQLFVSSRNHNKIKVLKPTVPLFAPLLPIIIILMTCILRIRVSFHDHQRVKIYDANGTELAVLGTGSSSNDNGNFYHPFGISFDSGGNFHVADSHNHRIQVFDTNHSFVRSYGVYGERPVSPYGFGMRIHF